MTSTKDYNCILSRNCATILRDALIVGSKYKIISFLLNLMSIMSFITPLDILAFCVICQNELALPRYILMSVFVLFELTTVYLIHNALTITFPVLPTTQIMTFLIALIVVPTICCILSRLTKPPLQLLLNGHVIFIIGVYSSCYMSLIV